jgi:excisionase family DNA binding protein
MTNFSFDSLPENISELNHRLERIENILTGYENQPEADQIWSVSEVAEFLKVSIPTIYGYTQKRSIPYLKKLGRLYFSKQQIIEWIKSSRKKTLVEAANDADEYLKIKKEVCHD